MDLLLSTPNPVASNLMGSDFVQVPELDSGEALISPPSSSFTVLPLPPPPPLIPAPEIMEVVAPAAVAAISSPKMPTQPMCSSPITSVPSTEAELQPLLNDGGNPQATVLIPAEPIATTPMAIEPILPPPSTTATTTTSTGLQMVTRKRSSMTAVNSGMAVGATLNPIAPTAVPAISPQSASVEAPTCDNASLEPQPPTSQPPKKKKKYTPKPKKTPNASSVTGTADGTANGTSKSSKSKKTPEASSTAPPATPAADGSEVTQTQPAKPKKPSKPKAPKKPSAAGSSSKSKSKKGKQPPPTILPAIKEMPEENIGGNELDSPTINQPGCLQQLVPPLKLQMPKLMKMPRCIGVTRILSPKMKIKNEPQDWDENGDQLLDPMMIAETEMNEDGSDESGNGKGSSRKKKSKGRNGNIYIGVFNRIEWMKLQNEFGFGSVNNFGTFVLQTMRRVHGDIQFWCDVASASGVYPDLDRYEWTNGFPHAVNKEGQHFTPEPDVTMSDEKREEVIEMAKDMWDKRLQDLKQLQHQELPVEEEAALLDSVPEDVEEDEDEDEDALPGLENYLENMASGQYSPPLPSLGCGGSAQTSTATTAAALTEEDVDRIWNEQMNDSDNLEKFGKLFSFINSIATMGKRQKEDEGIEGMVGEQDDPMLGGIGAGVIGGDGKANA